MGFFSGSDSDKKYSEECVANSPDSAKNRNSIIPAWDASTIDEITGKATSSLNKFFKNDAFSDAWDQLSLFNSWSAGSSKPGLKAYPFPSTEKYDKCVQNSGVSVWDENGWWRCLFPNSKARVGEVSLEDVENDRENSNGLFFRDYNQLLDWRSRLRKLANEKKEQDLAKEASNIQSIYDDYAKDVDFIDQENEQDVVRTSRSVYFRTLPNGDAEEITKIHNVYKDGQKKTEEIKKVFPKEGGEPIVTKVDHKSKGWIWNRDK